MLHHCGEASDLKKSGVVFGVELQEGDGLSHGGLGRIAMSSRVSEA